MHPENPVKNIDFLSHKAATIMAALAALCAVSYLPALNNGFISDDYVILARVSEWRADPLLIFRMTPEKFRITSYLVFGILKSILGYRAAGYYCFTILLHFANAVLLWRLLGRVAGSPGVAVLGSVIFAVLQNPNEGVMWLAAMNEELLTLFVLAAILLWLHDRHIWSAAACLGALFSKESAAAILLLLPLIDIAANHRPFLRRQILCLVIPVAIFGLVFILSLPENALVDSGSYGLGVRALTVWLISLHRFMFPWMYIVLPIWLLARRGAWPSGAVHGFSWMAAALLPYLFLTYQNHVPSRHMYLAAVGYAWALAEITWGIRISRLKTVLVAAFIVVNIAYLWIVKDHQYEIRAAPTTRLIEQLSHRSPGPVLVENFPLNPWIAKESVWAIPGWNPQMIRVNEPPESCPDCFGLQWDPRSEQYLVVRFTNDNRQKKSVRLPLFQAIDRRGPRA